MVERARGYWPPLIAVSAAVAIAVLLTLFVHHGASARPRTPAIPPAASKAEAVPTRPLHSGPHEAALRTARRIIATAPTPPGATRIDRSPLSALNHPSETPGAQHVQRTAFWTAPGTVHDAIGYLTGHAPPGMSAVGSGSSGGPNRPITESLEFQAGELRTLEYTVVLDGRGVAIRADAQVLWAPRRSVADTVAPSLTSVDVLVVRTKPQLHTGAPTVSRTLTGRAARALADYVDRLPRAIPTGYISCPAMLGGERAVDRLVFKGTGPTAQLVVDLRGCASATFTAAGRKPIQLSFTFPGAIADVNHTILAAVGLPDNYGH